MKLTLEELQLIEECVRLRSMQHQRIAFSSHPSEDEKMEAKREILKIETFQRNFLAEALWKAEKKEKKNNGK